MLVSYSGDASGTVKEEQEKIPVLKNLTILEKENQEEGKVKGPPVWPYTRHTRFFIRSVDTYRLDVSVYTLRK